MGFLGVRYVFSPFFFYNFWVEMTGLTLVAIESQADGPRAEPQGPGARGQGAGQRLCLGRGGQGRGDGGRCVCGVDGR